MPEEEFQFDLPQCLTCRRFFEPSDSAVASLGTVGEDIQGIFAPEVRDILHSQAQKSQGLEALPIDPDSDPDCFVVYLPTVGQFLVKVTILAPD